MSGVDRTQEFSNFFIGEFVGKEVNRGNEVIEDNTSSGFGNQIMASGSCNAFQHLSTNGYIKHLDLSDFDPDLKNVWSARLNMSFRYTGNSTGFRRSCAFGGCNNVPGNLWSGNVSKGVITVIWSVDPQQASKIAVHVKTDADHEDRPGHYIERWVAPLLADIAKRLTKDFTGTQIVGFVAETDYIVETLKNLGETGILTVLDFHSEELPSSEASTT